MNFLPGRWYEFPVNFVGSSFSRLFRFGGNRCILLHQIGLFHGWFWRVDKTTKIRTTMRVRTKSLKNMAATLAELGELRKEIAACEAQSARFSFAPPQVHILLCRDRSTAARSPAQLRAPVRHALARPRPRRRRLRRLRCRRPARGCAEPHRPRRREQR